MATYPSLKAEAVYRGDDPGPMRYYYFPMEFGDVDMEMVSDYEDWRKDLKEHLKQVAQILYCEDNFMGILLDDECSDCGKVLKDCRCERE